MPGVGGKSIRNDPGQTQRGAAAPGKPRGIAWWDSGCWAVREPSGEGTAWEMACWRRRKEMQGSWEDARKTGLHQCACCSLSQFFLNLPSFYCLQTHEDAIASMKWRLHKSPEIFDTKDSYQIITSRFLQDLHQLCLFKNSLGINGIFPK